MVCFSSNQNKIEDIKTRQAETAESLIRLQFRMEQLVFCQDQIYSGVLQKVREEVFNPVGNPVQSLPFNLPSPQNASSVSSITEIGVHLNAYFSVSVGVLGTVWGVLAESCLAE